MNKFEIISKEQYDKDFPKRKNVAKYDELKLPRRATTLSAGYDIYSPYEFELPPGHTIKIPTGIRALLDENKFLLILPRSGLGFKYRLQLDNTIGVIDADYSYSDNEGHIWAKITNDSKNDKTLFIKKGDAFAQGIILEFFKTVDDDADGIRNGGFGSTSK